MIWVCTQEDVSQCKPLDSACTCT